MHKNKLMNVKREIKQLLKYSKHYLRNAKRSINNKELAFAHFASSSIRLYTVDEILRKRFKLPQAKHRWKTYKYLFQNGTNKESQDLIPIYLKETNNIYHFMLRDNVAHYETYKSKKSQKAKGLAGRRRAVQKVSLKSANKLLNNIHEIIANDCNQLKL